MSLRSKGTMTLVAVALNLAASSLPVQADVIQLFSPDQLGNNVTTVSHTSTTDILSSPHVVITADNALTFVLAVGDWRRLDEGVNVVSDFAPGTHLLYTNNNNGQDLTGQGSIGGGGSGPAEIVFAEGVRAVGFKAQSQVLGLETLTFSAYNDLTLLGTFSVTRVIGQQQNDSASFLGVRATGTDVITKIVLSSNVLAPTGPHANDFFFGPISYVPEPSLVALLSLAALGFGVKRRRTR